MTDLDLADLCLALYAGRMSSFDYSLETCGVVWAMQKTPTASVVVLRGSVTFEDWARDLLAAGGIVINHAQLGPVHSGFALGMSSVWLRLRALSSGPYIVCGHSLGAGRSAILAGLMIGDGAKVLRRVAFGEPKPGFKQLANMLATVPQASYRNSDGRHHDLITDVPLTFPPEFYVHPVDLTDVCAAPPAEDSWGPFAWHHMELYRAALAKKETECTTK